MKDIPMMNVGDVVELKKNHPCGNKSFKILRIGSDIKIECCECGRTLTLERTKVEKMIKNFISRGNNDDK